jgi:hypothetical protein
MEINITAKSVKEFEKLQEAYNNLHPKVKEEVEFVSNQLSGVEFIFKKRFDNGLTRIMITDDIYTIESTSTHTIIHTGFGKFIAFPSEKGFSLTVCKKL